MTLITAANSGGAYGRCDAKCHDATEPECHCICGGCFHGKGSGSSALPEAIEVREREIMAALRAEGLRVFIPGEIAQGSLF
ncbi:MAG TPA: hypothetical protein VMW54_04385 [Terriglobia bacterium]|nr:hypothetical protein [Terriglobia bacterium]